MLFLILRLLDNTVLLFLLWWVVWVLWWGIAGWVSIVLWDWLRVVVLVWLLRIAASRARALLWWRVGASAGAWVWRSSTLVSSRIASLLLWGIWVVTWMSWWIRGSSCSWVRLITSDSLVVAWWSQSVQSFNTQDSHMSVVGVHAWQWVVEITPNIDIAGVGGSHTRFNQWDWHLRWNLIPLQALKVQNPVVDQTLNITMTIVDFTTSEEDKAGDGVQTGLTASWWIASLLVTLTKLGGEVLRVEVENVKTAVVQMAIGRGAQEVDASENNIISKVLYLHYLCYA